MKIAIQGHSTRGKEVIQILESLGGKNRNYFVGGRFSQYYFINCYGNIDLDLKTNLLNCKFYTLEEFEKEFPFKVGDKIKYISSIGIIKEYCYINNELAYKIESADLGIIATMPAKELKPYKEMERNITLTLEKAKEWYKKGGELKEIALQAFTEKELNPLPRSWEEFCKKYSVKEGESWLGEQNRIHTCTASYDGMDRIYKNWTPSKKSAEAHLAMIQLEQLRNCWWGGWEPEWDSSTKYCIHLIKNELVVGVSKIISRFLVFPTREMAEEFLECFRDLIEKAGDLI